MKRIIGVLSLFIIVLGGCSKDVESHEIVFWNSEVLAEDPNGVIPDEEMPLALAIDQFEEDNPGYTITTVDYSFDEFQQAFTAANLAEEGPDVVAMRTGSTTLGYSNYLQPLDSSLSNKEKGEYDVSAISHLNFNMDDDLIAFPSTSYATGIFYNKSIMNDNDVDIESVVTWDDLLAASDKLLSAGVVPMCAGDVGGAASVWNVASLYIDLVGPEGISQLFTGEVDFNNPDTITAISTWKQMIDNGYLNQDWSSTTDGDAIDDFVNGGCGMLTQGTWAAGLFGGLGEDLGVIKIPQISEDAEYGDYVMSQPIANIAVTSYSEEQEKSIEFAKMISSPEFISANTAIQYGDENVANVVEEMNEWTDLSALSFDTVLSAEADAEFYKLIANTLKNDESVEELLTSIDEINKKYK